MPATAYVDVTVHAYNYQKTLSYKVTVKEKNPLKGITLQKNLTVGVNNEVNLSALLNPVNPDNNPDLKWTISDKEIISISPYNECSVHIVGLKPGTATITVRTRDSFKTGKKEAPFTASCKVTVKPSVSVTFNVFDQVKTIRADKSKMTIGTRGNSKFGRISIAAVTPYYATYPSVRWNVDKNNTGVLLGVINDDRTERNAAFAANPRESVITRKYESLAVMGITPGVVKITGVTTDRS